LRAPEEEYTARGTEYKVEPPEHPATVIEVVPGFRVKEQEGVVDQQYMAFWVTDANP